MTITDVVAKKGYTFRQHLEEQGWGWRALTVVDLTAEQKKALDEGGAAGLTEELRKSGQYSFPATDITEVPVIRNWIPLTAKQPLPVVAADELVPAAKDAIARIQAATGVALKMVSADEATLDLLQQGDVILFGGSHQSRFGLDLALRYQTTAFDSAVPGPGGWAITTHVGIERNGNLVLQVAADGQSATDAVTTLLEAIDTASGSTPRIRWQHRVVPGPEMAATLNPWEEYVATFKDRLTMPTQGTLPDANDIDGLARFLLQGLDSGGREKSWYNQAPLTISVESARYYMVTGDERALRLFRGLLYTMADYYLLTPDGASYPADFDFILGHMVLYYSRLEHTPVFSDEDRLFLSNLLLACSRSVNEYARAFWSPDHGKDKVLANGESGVNNRHNHQTFPARSLLFAHDYFSRYGIADADSFLEYTEAIFSGDMWDRGKQTENAGIYEVLVYDHGAVYSCFTGRRLDLYNRDAFLNAARRMVTITDNFFRVSDCGDTGASMARGSDDVLPVLASCCYGDEMMSWFVAESIRHSRNHAMLGKIPGHGTPGLRTAGKGRQPECNRWERIPLDPKFTRQFIPNPPEQSRLFDKMAFRTGWNEDDQYVLLEGVGGKKISHSHIDCNSVVRYNHLGRHWLISNGYGRLVGVTNVSQSFSTRVLGPNDHNMLVLTKGDEVIKETPLACEQLCYGSQGSIAYSSANVRNYGGVDWNRSVIIIAGVGLLVVDRIAVSDTPPDSAHIEWNILGDCTVDGPNATLHQKGVYLHVTTAGGWPMSQSCNDRSADWKSVLSGNQYPYASFPVPKLVLQAPELSPSTSHTVASLFAAGKSASRTLALSQAADGSTVTVSGLTIEPVTITDAPVNISVSGEKLTFSFLPTRG